MIALVRERGSAVGDDELAALRRGRAARRHDARRGPRGLLRRRVDPGLGPCRAAPGSAGVPHREADEGDDGAAERDLDQGLRGARTRRKRLRTHRDHHELDRDDARRPPSAPSTGRWIRNGSACIVPPTNVATPVIVRADRAAPAAGQLAVVGEPLGEPHRDGRAERGGQADEERGARPAT